MTAAGGSSSTPGEPGRRLAIATWLETGQNDRSSSGNRDTPAVGDREHDLLGAAPIVSFEVRDRKNVTINSVNITLQPHISKNEVPIMCQVAVWSRVG